MSALPGPEETFNPRTLALESDRMLAFSDWFPLATAGLTFTILGGVKLWGFHRSIVGGAGKPAVQRLCGT